ncbi:MAG: molybdopterin molybdenumtransferase [Leifsonia sp.]|nr:molybdopterin molybdenumtransferase [Leifsonia sp.]
MVGTSRMRSVEEHLDDILAGVRELPVESVPLDAALGRVLAREVTATTAIPPFDNSAMDGYAVRAEDVRGASDTAIVSLPVSADLPAGAAADARLEPGTAARIMTGAPVPPGADAIVPVEHTDGGTASVRVHREAPLGAHVRRAGTDLEAGATVLPPGATLTSRAIAAAASAGRATVEVHARPRVAVISTGSELVPPGEPTRRGQIPDSNSFLLAAAVAEAGGAALRLGSVADDVDALRALLERAAREADAIVLSGGVSVGAYDVVKELLAPLGVRFGTVRMQPGKPQGFGHWLDGTPIFALPGNPVSAAVSFEVFVRPALRRLQGLPEVHRPRSTGTAEVGWRTPPGRQQYIPVTIVRDAAGAARVRPATAGGSGSHLVASLALADGLAIVDAEVEEVCHGDVVEVLDWRDQPPTA